MEAAEVEQAIVESLGRNAVGWSITASINERGRWQVLLEHPASTGLVFDTAASDGFEALSFVLAGLNSNEEIAFVASAPALTHPDAVSGVRGLTQAFTWHNREVASVAFLMFECGCLSEPETAWLAGFIGGGAPGRPRSPVGPF